MALQNENSKHLKCSSRGSARGSEMLDPEKMFKKQKTISFKKD